MPLERIEDLKKIYIEKHFASQTPLHQKILKKLHIDHKEGINISSTEGHMLAFFVKTFQVKRILEIGTLYGYSALWMAQALPPKGSLITLESDPHNAQKARLLLASEKRVQIIEGDAKETLKQLTGFFDLIFIDANKSDYKHYLDWAEKHTQKGGLIIGDNTFLFGAMYDDKEAQKANKKAFCSMKKFNERLAKKNMYESMLIPTQQGLTVARKK